MTNSSDIIAQALYRAGVRHAFGIPGGEVLTLIDALERAGIRFVIARHENAAGFMAEGAYRATGAPGVLVATVGPGVANGVNSIANAQQERVPLIVLTGRVAEADALTYTHQVFDHAAALRPFVKASFEAREGACDVMIDKALHIATALRPGPVHVDLPIPVARAAHAPHRGAPPVTSAAVAPAQGPAVDHARRIFQAAERPLLLVGQDILGEPGGCEALRAFARQHGIPVLSTYKAKGVLPETDPLCLGGHGLSPKSDAIVLPLLAKADMVIAAGYDPIEMRSGWRDPVAPDRMVSISAGINDHFMHREAVHFQCPVREGLAIFNGLSPRNVWPDGTPPATREALATAFTAAPGWGPGAAFAALASALPAGTRLTVDSGAHRILLSQMLHCDAPGQLMQSTGLCTMGCALPMATGHALARPGQPVVAVMGDGCLDMVLGELATLRDLGLPVVVVVLVDGSYALIARKQQSEGYANAGVDFGETDYAGIARAIGIGAHTAPDAVALQEALGLCLASGSPGLVAVPIPRDAYAGLI